MKTIYLDHAATSPVHPEVTETVYETMKQHYGNASSIHQFGRSSRKILDNARKTFADSIGAKPDEIVVTSGGTEGDNTAIIQTALARQSEGKHLITSAVEHHAVLRPMEYLETLGFEVTYLPVDEHGQVRVEDVQAALRPDTILVSIMYGNNEVGSLMKIHEIATVIKENNANTWFHTDAVQAYGTEDIDVKRDNIDFLSVSAHKINGPKGIGFLYINESCHLPSFIRGGEQERKRRAGTENIPSIAGFQKAVEIMQEEKEKRNKKYTQLRALLLNSLQEASVDFSINGNSDSRLDQIVSIWLKGVSSEQLLVNLDLSGFAVSAGSACTAGNVDPSHVLVAMLGEESPAIAETIRVSFGYNTTEEDVLAFSNQLVKYVERLKK